MDSWDDFYAGAGSLFATGVDVWTKYNATQNAPASSSPGAVYNASAGGAAASAPAQSAAGGMGTGMIMAIIAGVMFFMLLMVLLLRR